MTNMVRWNVRGLNWPNKQEDVKLFLHTNKVGLVGLLETKVKPPTVDHIASKIFMGWKWQHNFYLKPKGRIWVAWKPAAYHLEVLQVTEQMVHGKATELCSNKKKILHHYNLWDEPRVPKATTMG